MRTDTAAPSFNPEHPRELLHYFMELELLMASARVTAEQECKLLATRYIPFDDCQLWSGLPEFSPNLTYEEFKVAILKLYPGAMEEQTFMFVDINRVTSKQLWLGIQSKEELVAYHRQFLAITQYLILCNRLWQMSKDEHFYRVSDSTFCRESISTCRLSSQITSPMIRTC